MSSPLRHIEFNPDMLARSSVQSFDCGPEEWEREIAEWLKAPPGAGGAADDMAVAGNPVWLYATDEGDLVGVGSIGPATASWPKNSSPRLAATCITWLAVDVRHRGQGYGQSILDHLLGEAKLRADKFPLVVLYVHADNRKAADWYGSRRNNFVPLGNPAPRKVASTNVWS